MKYILSIKEVIITSLLPGFPKRTSHFSIRDNENHSFPVPAIHGIRAAPMTADHPDRLEGILEIREVRDLGVAEDAQRRLHAVAADHAAHDHLVGVF